jgi:hypothetical protein
MEIWLGATKSLLAIQGTQVDENYEFAYSLFANHGLADGLLL